MHDEMSNYVALASHAHPKQDGNGPAQSIAVWLMNDFLSIQFNNY